MTAQNFFLILHLLLFAYWLGGDIGVFYSSGMVIDPRLGIEARRIAGKIMMNLDLVPRICLSLMLTVGGILTEYFGIEHPPWQWAAIILLGPVWLAMVLTIHLKEGTALGKTVTRVDYWFRWLVIVAIIASVSYSFATGRLADEPWIGYKLLIFAFLIFCGLMIRMNLGGFGVGLHRIAQGAISDAENAAMVASLDKVRIFVYAIWTGVIIEAVMGVVKPGSASAAENISAVGSALQALLAGVS